jgi:hypothetical protein
MITSRALATISVALGALSACEGPLPDELGAEGSEEALTADDFKSRVIPNISRVVTVANGQQRRLTGEAYQAPRCKWVKDPYSDPPRRAVCTTPATDYTNAILHENPNAVASDAPFPAKWGSQPYQGCGVAAAYNVLAYYGAANPWPAGIRYTKFTDSRIMSVPSYLRADLENALNNQANGRYSVRIFHGAPAYRIVGQALSSGNVVVALVDGGTHWQVITGMRTAGSDSWGRTIFEYYALDYGFGGQWRTEGQLQLGFSALPAVGSHIGGAEAVDYRSDTFLIVHKL